MPLKMMPLMVPGENNSLNITKNIQCETSQGNHFEHSKKMFTRVQSCLKINVRLRIVINCILYLKWISVTLLSLKFSHCELLKLFNSSLI